MRDDALERSRASTEPAMVIAGGRESDDDGVRVPLASTEPAMVIAGGAKGRLREPRRPHASTEPAMVIAGGRPLSRPSPSFERSLQRSRRW